MTPTTRRIRRDAAVAPPAPAAAARRQRRRSRHRSGRRDRRPRAAPPRAGRGARGRQRDGWQRARRHGRQPHRAVAVARPGRRRGGRGGATGGAGAGRRAARAAAVAAGRRPACWRRACAGSGAWTSRTRRSRASRGRAPVFVARFSGTALAASSTTPARSSSRPSSTARRGPVHHDVGHGELQPGDRARGRRAHRGALSPDRRRPGRFAADVADRDGRRADGATRRSGQAHRGDRRFDQRRLRHAGHARRRRVFRDREPLGRVPVVRGARAGRRGQHHRRVRPRHLSGTTAAT